MNEQILVFIVENGHDVSVYMAYISYMLYLLYALVGGYE